MERKPNFVYRTSGTSWEGWRVSINAISSFGLAVISRQIWKLQRELTSMSAQRGKGKVTRAKEAHTARAYPGFCSMNQLRGLLLPPGWDFSPLQGYTQQYVAGTHLYTWVERDNVGLSFLSKETTQWQGLGVERLTFRSEVQPLHHHAHPAQRDLTVFYSWAVLQKLTPSSWNAVITVLTTKQWQPKQCGKGTLYWCGQHVISRKKLKHLLPTYLSQWICIVS